MDINAHVFYISLAIFFSHMKWLSKTLHMHLLPLWPQQSKWQKWIPHGWKVVLFGTTFWRFVKVAAPGPPQRSCLLLRGWWRECGNPLAAGFVDSSPMVSHRGREGEGGGGVGDWGESDTDRVGGGDGCEVRERPGFSIANLVLATHSLGASN